MSKISRNDPCPCGSGKKYKKCCLKKDDEISVEAKQANEAQRQKSKKVLKNILPNLAKALHGADELDELDELSNSIVDLIHTGDFDEAEKRCTELLNDYPDVVDGYDRFAMLHEKRGEYQTAAEYYQKAADLMQSSGGYAQEMIDFTLGKVEQLSGKD